MARATTHSTVHLDGSPQAQIVLKEDGVLAANANLLFPPWRSCSKKGTRGART